MADKHLPNLLVMTRKMTTQVVGTPVTKNSSSQKYPRLDDHTIIIIIIIIIILIIIIIIINIYIVQIPCEYDQMRVTNKDDTNQT